MAEDLPIMTESSETMPPEAPSLGVEHAGRFTRWVLPSIADLFFLVLVGILGFSPMSVALLGDADTGWHIRSGDYILANHSVPRVDLFSYTRVGQPWYAWEWLYDVGISLIHRVAGLNGVVLFSAVVIAATFALLFRFVLRRSGSFAIAVGLTVLAFSAAQVHMLARPHILGWLLTLLWVEALYRYEEGKRSALLWLPSLMLLWVNVHGGFILGLVLLAVFGSSRMWTYFFAPSVAVLRQIFELAAVLGICLVVTLATPYGYQLHVHVYQYLSNTFLMNSINEFMSPDFHLPGYGYFELFILLSVVGAMLARGRSSTTDLLLILFSIHAGLLAARNIPLAVILMSLALGPLLAAIGCSDERRYPSPVASLLDLVHDISGNMGRMEKQFRGHAVVLAVVAISIGIALNGGRVLSAKVLSAHFDEKVFPVRATEFIAAKGIHDHMFNPDYWSGYLIYKLYPGTKLYFDDRHDFYGEDFIKDYLKATHGDWDWRVPLEKYEVKWVLIPVHSPLSSLLKESGTWRLEYDDGLATVFSRLP
jgi:hypothetical protein